MTQKENLIKMLKYTIDKNNVEIITAVCRRKDLFTKRNVDKLIERYPTHPKWRNGRNTGNSDDIQE